MRYCNVCGNVIPQGSNVCPVCGTPVQAQPVVQKKKQTWKKVLVVYICLVLFVLACLGVVTLIESNSNNDSDSGSSSHSGILLPAETVDARSAVRSYLDAMFVDFDYYELSKYLYDEEIEAKCDKEGVSVSSFESGLKSMLKSLEDAKEEGVRVRYDVLDRDGFDVDDVEDIKKKYKDDYDIEIDDARKFDIDYTITGSATDMNQDEKVTAVKIDGEWYVSIN